MHSIQRRTLLKCKGACIFFVGRLRLRHLRASPDRAVPQIPLGLSIFFVGSSATPTPARALHLIPLCSSIVKIFFWLQPYKLTHNWRKFKLFTYIDSRVTGGNGIKSFLDFGPPSHTLCKCERKT